MAKLVDVKNSSQKLHLKHRQLPIPVDDDKVMILQLSQLCEYCKEKKDNGKRGRIVVEGQSENGDCSKKGKQYSDQNHHDQNSVKRKSWSVEQFLTQYSKLSREEVLAATVVPAQTLFSRLAQVVSCVGCRRSVEKLFNQLKTADYPAMEPLIITNSGLLTVFMNYSLQPKVLNTLFSQHKTPLNEMLDNIPKYKKSGRCILHCMDSVRCRSGSSSWIDMWDEMKDNCRESVTIINTDQLLGTLDTYLRKHRFCHECKNKVHRAYNILVGNITIDPNKEKGYVASLYAGIMKNGKYVTVSSDTEFIMNLITRAEPELQGRDSLFLSRERHAKTLEIAQEEVLTCVGLFLYERLQRIYSRMKEEEQSFDILFHVGLDVIRRNFELAVEEKQGFSKFEKFCEELQQQELMEKAKKEKRNRKRKNKKRIDESKENYNCEEEKLSCDDCEKNRSPLQGSSKALGRQSAHQPVSQELKSTFEDSSEANWRVVGTRKPQYRTERSCSEDKEDPPFIPFLQNAAQHASSHHLQCSASIDSLASRCSQCSRDGGYCSAQCSSGSSRDSSEVACGDGFCFHSDELDPNSHHHDHPTEKRHADSVTASRCQSLSPALSKHSSAYAPSLTELLDDSSCEADEIPEAEVQAWHARLGAVKQKRAELRQTLRQRFQQLCYRKSLSAINGNLINEDLSSSPTAPQPAVPLQCHHCSGGTGLLSVN